MDIDKQSFFGHFSTWDDAMKVVPNGGYGNENIFKKVVDATESVRRGDCAFESDGKCYRRKEYKYYLLSTLFQVVIKYGYLNIIDYGGSLGSLYYRHRKMFRFPTIWNIVEQTHYVDYGRKNIPELNFFYNMDECINSFKDKPVNCVLFAGSLEYLQDPYAVLDSVVNNGINSIIVDTVQLGEMKNDWLCIQRIPEEIYSNTEYPIWLLAKDKFSNYFMKNSYIEIDSWVHPWRSMVCDGKDEIHVVEQGQYWEKH